ncbi:MAG: adenylate kinase [Candidatus Nitrosotenuis sp.]|uniref:Adenylate kinase n=1 Tax=Candidatus Nitrosotenuis uzonensis TaxID=1407055 RepID=A0A812EY10_9ARCH|nr:adenylate kinase [Candidatus Nitrosotenuis uzonensis]CAE6484775.1 Adenylate kinase [Candidatus Nitrosotenuis uzonensis]
MAESKKVVIVGIAGVGKTTLVAKIVEILNSKKKSVSVHSFGTIMFEEAKKMGIKDRDELRKLPVEKQKELQMMAAKTISGFNDNVVIIDTHAFISTKEGFYPGLPYHVLGELKPENLITVSARPEEIYNRRMKDSTRHRDIISIENIKKELAVQDAMLSSCAVLTGSPMKSVLNSEGKVQEAANEVINAIGL